MTDDQVEKVTRIAAIRLMRREIPGAPPGAVGPPSQWWDAAQEVVDAITPYMREFLRDV